MLLSLSQPPHLPWGQPSQSLPQPAPKQANGGFRVFSLLGNLLNQHQRAAPPPLPGSSLQTFQSSLVWITSTPSEWALTGRPFLIRKQFLQHKKCLWEDRDAADKKWCFVTVNWNWALWFSCYKFFNFSWVQHGKELSQKGLFFFFPVHGACGWALTENNVDLAQALWELGRAPREHSPEERMGPKPKARHCRF